MKAAWVLVLPLALTLAACDNSDDDDAAGSGGTAQNCSTPVPIDVTGELSPMYTWDVPDDMDDGVYSLAVARVENLEFIASNSQDCIPSSPGADVDERCEIAYSMTSSPDSSNPSTPTNNVTPPVMHGQASPSDFSTIAVTEEDPLEMGVEYQISVVRGDSNNSAEVCGCLRFNAGTAESGDGSCS